MSDLPMLEMFPNEILLDIYGYLTALEIFTAFDRLNNRFDRLIRTIFLHLNFHHLRKDIFDHFCTTMRVQPTIRNHLSSLELSNRQTCGQIELFLSLFSLVEFPSIRRLSLLDLEQQTIERLRTILPSISTLRTLYLTLEKNQLLKQSIFTHPLTITHLTISSCSFDQILDYTPLLQSLHVHQILQSSRTIKTTEQSKLKQLTIENIEYSFEELQILFRSTPNLRRLIISAFDNISMIDAVAWQDSIQSFLPRLKLFQLVFGLFCKGQIRTNIISKFQLFHTPFWLEVHRWNTEYVLDTNSAVIYTIPYPNSVYRLRPTAEKSSGNLNAFDKVTNLVLCCEGIPEKIHYSNVESLTLEPMFTTDRLLRLNSLRKVLSFDHLKHLDISAYLTVDSSSLVELLKVSPQLSSLAFDSSLLAMFFRDRELCQYFHERIKRLSIGHQLSEVQQFGEIFTNLEQLTCGIDRVERVSMLLESLTKLSSLNVTLIGSGQLEEIELWLTNEASKFNVIYRIHHCHWSGHTRKELNKTELCIWTGGVKGQILSL